MYTVQQATFERKLTEVYVYKINSEKDDHPTVQKVYQTPISNLIRPYLAKNKFHLTNDQLRELHNSTNDQMFEDKNALYTMDSIEQVKGFIFFSKNKVNQHYFANFVK